MGKVVFVTLILLLVYQLLTLVVAQEECTVKIQNGTVFGQTTDTTDPSRRVCSYTAIPFAAPPIGPLRFQAPQPPQPWGDEGLNATSPPNLCPQGVSPLGGGKISEDCLYLNVHVPISSAKAENFPVMIWFHGGGFTTGSSEFYSPARLLAQGGVILVTAHYRLGLLGFLGTGDASSPGNYGLKDQAQSIRWVGENIKEFGGDPGKVTVFGESAGSASAIYQLITPLNKGRIHGIIAQSGTILSSGAIDRTPLASAKLMAKRLGCPESPNEAIVSCMRNLTWETIVAEQGKYSAESYSAMRKPIATIRPVVEPNLPGAFITKEPKEIIENEEIPNNIPVMLGANKHDGSFGLALLYLARYGPHKLDQDPEYMRNTAVPDLLKFFEVAEDDGNRAAASSVELAYLGGVNRSSFNESMPGLVDMFTVFAFKSPILNTAELLARRGLNVYLYSFEHHSNNSIFKMFGLQKTPVQGGITHADDLIYLFNWPLTLSKDDLSFSEILCEMWLNFGKTGNPTPTASDRYTQWPPYNTIDEPFMKLNNTPTVLHDYRTSWCPNGFQWN